MQTVASPEPVTMQRCTMIVPRRSLIVQLDATTVQRVEMIAQRVEMIVLRRHVYRLLRGADRDGVLHKPNARSDEAIARFAEMSASLAPRAASCTRSNAFDTMVRLSLIHI